MKSAVLTEEIAPVSHSSSGSSPSQRVSDEKDDVGQLVGEQHDRGSGQDADDEDKENRVDAHAGIVAQSAAL
jgi:hypothetical protein